MKRVPSIHQSEYNMRGLHSRHQRRDPNFCDKEGSMLANLDLKQRMTSWTMGKVFYKRELYTFRAQPSTTKSNESNNNKQDVKKGGEPDIQAKNRTSNDFSSNRLPKLVQRWLPAINPLSPYHRCMPRCFLQDSKKERQGTWIETKRLLCQLALFKKIQLIYSNNRKKQWSRERRLFWDSWLKGDRPTLREVGRVCFIPFTVNWPSSVTR